MGRQVAVYLALPLFTNHMTSEEFGVVALMTSLLSFIDVLSNGGLPAATFRLYNDTDDATLRRLTLGSSLMLFVVYATVIAVGVWIAAVPLTQVLVGSVTYTPVMRIVAVLLVAGTLVNFGDILLRIQVHPLASSMQSFAQILAQLGLALILVIRYDLGARGYWLGQLGGAILGLGIMFWLVRATLTFQVSRERINELTAYALPLIPATLAMWALRLADRTLIVRFADLDALAVYEVGYKIGMLAGLAMIPFLTAWPQFAFSSMHKPHAPRIYTGVLVYIAVVCTFAALAVMAFRTDLVSLMAPPAYATATAVVPWIALSQVAFGMYPVLAVGLHLTKRTSHVAIMTFLAATINVILNVVLIPVIGIQGSAVANLAGYVGLASLSYIVSRRFYSYPIDWRRLSKIALAGGLTSLLVIWLGQVYVPVWEGRALRAAGLLLFPVTLLATGFVTRTQYIELWQLGTDLCQQLPGIGRLEEAWKVNDKIR